MLADTVAFDESLLVIVTYTPPAEAPLLSVTGNWIDCPTATDRPLWT